MAKGGRREGAGRKSGVPNKASREREKRIAESGETPLEVMVAAYRWYYLKFKAEIAKEKPDESRAREMLDAACDAAAEAAQFVHPKLAAVRHVGEVVHRLAQLSDAELREKAIREADALGVTLEGFMIDVTPAGQGDTVQ